jgi:hypothetical protein
VRHDRLAALRAEHYVRRGLQVLLAARRRSRPSGGSLLGDPHGLLLGFGERVRRLGRPTVFSQGRTGPRAASAR